MADKDLYAALGVARDAGEDEIKKAYRKLAREHHPDVNPNDPSAEERFKEISFANTVLSDPEKKARYDEFGMQGLAEGFDPEQARGYARWSRGAHQSPHFESFTSEADLDDLLSGFFAGGQRSRGPSRGRDAEGNLQVEFLDAVRGGEITTHFEGRAPIRVKIPAGTSEGSRIRLAGQGAPGHEGGPAGDLFLTLHIKPHPFFVRNGDNLEVSLPVTLPELILGSSVEVPTPDGRVSMQIPPGSQNGQKLRLRGKGAKRAKGDGNGDLFVILHAVMPEKHDANLEEIAKELESLYEGQMVRKNLGIDT